MDKSSDWRRFNELFFSNPKLSISMDFSHMELQPDFPARLQKELTKALDDMESLEAGALANPDEKRMVGHYWLRAPDLAPSEEIKDEIIEALQGVREFAAQVHFGSQLSSTGKKFTNVFLLGIGGSILGPELLRAALSGPQDKMKLHFLDNTDPDGYYMAFRRLHHELDRTLCVVVSKSGETMETLNAMKETKAAFARSGLDFAKQAVAITGPGSSLEKRAKQEEWLRTFPIWEWVGGRTSLFSPVGMLPAALMGLDIDALLKGAARMDRATRKRELKQNPAALLAGAWYEAVNGSDLGEMVVLPYKDRLQLWTRYLQQLLMESLGKATDLDGKEVHSGIVVYGNKGSFDQHVLLQHLCDGPVGPFVVFLHVLRDVCGAAWGSGGAWDVEEKVEPETTSGDCLLAQMLGTRHALKRKHRPSMTLAIQRLDPPSLGQLVALHERAVGLYASLVRVNAYNQPSLELGKEEARWVLESQKKVMSILREAQPEPLSSAQIARKAGFGDRVETVYKLLTHLAANVNRGVRRRKASTPDKEEFWWEKGTSRG